MNNFAIPQFPNDFEDTLIGIKIDDETINDWIEEGINFLENNPNEDYYYTSGGNVLINIYKIDLENDKYQYAITISCGKPTPLGVGWIAQ